MPHLRSYNMYKLVFDKDLNKICSITKNDGSGTIVSIPLSEDNTDYQAYLKWLDEGNTPEPADE